MGLMSYFDVLIGREDVENPKPHPEPIFKALSKLQGDKNKYAIKYTINPIGILHQRDYQIKPLIYD